MFMAISNPWLLAAIVITVVVTLYFYQKSKPQPTSLETVDSHLEQADDHKAAMYDSLTQAKDAANAHIESKKAQNEALAASIADNHSEITTAGYKLKSIENSLAPSYNQVGG